MSGIALAIHLREGHLPENPYNPMAWIKDNPTIGEGTWIGAFCLIDGSGGLTIGKGCNISCGAHILTHSTARRCVTARAYPAIDYAPTVLGDHVFVGENATILMGAQIGDRCVVGAACLVTENAHIPSDCVVMGVPYRIRDRRSPAALARGACKRCDCQIDYDGDGHYDIAACEEHEDA